MTTEYKEFLPRVSPEVIGCPVPVILQAIRDAVQEFCEKTWIWQEVVDCTITEDDRELVLSLPTGAKLVSVRYLLKDGKEQVVPDNLFIRADEFEFEFEAEESQELKARVALKPTSTSIECPEWLFKDHAEAITQGAKARLLYDNRKTWGNPDLAVLNHQMFRKAITQEKIKLHQGYAMKTSRVKPRRFV